MHKRIILAILIALTIAAPAASQHFTIVDCDGIQVEYIRKDIGVSENLCPIIDTLRNIPERQDMEVSKVVFYDLADWHITLHLVAPGADDFSMSMSLMGVGYGVYACGLAEIVDVTLFYDVDLHFADLRFRDSASALLIVDLAAGSYTCPDGDINHTVLYDHSAWWSSNSILKIVKHTSE